MRTCILLLVYPKLLGQRYVCISIAYTTLLADERYHYPILAHMKYVD